MIEIEKINPPDLKAMNMADLAVYKSELDAQLVRKVKIKLKLHGEDREQAKREEIELTTSWVKVQQEISERVNELHLRLKGGENG